MQRNITTLYYTQCFNFIPDNHILGDPGAVSQVDKMFVVKVYCKIETSPWALTLTEPVPEAFELPASDWPEKNFSGQSAKRSSRVTLMFSYTT